MQDQKKMPHSKSRFFSLHSFCHLCKTLHWRRGFSHTAFSRIIFSLWYVAIWWEALALKNPPLRQTKIQREKGTRTCRSTLNHRWGSCSGTYTPKFPQYTSNLPNPFNCFLRGISRDSLEFWKSPGGDSFLSWMFFIFDQGCPAKFSPALTPTITIHPDLPGNVLLAIRRCSKQNLWDLSSFWFKK